MINATSKVAHILSNHTIIIILYQNNAIIIILLYQILHQRVTPLFIDFDLSKAAGLKFGRFKSSVFTRRKVNSKFQLGRTLVIPRQATATD